jgi:hypothetical protein
MYSICNVRAGDEFIFVYTRYKANMGLDKDLYIYTYIYINTDNTYRIYRYLSTSNKRHELREQSEFNGTKAIQD